MHKRAGFKLLFFLEIETGKYVIRYPEGIIVFDNIAFSKEAAMLLMMASRLGISRSTVGFGSAAQGAPSEYDRSEDGLRAHVSLEGFTKRIKDQNFINSI